MLAGRTEEPPTGAKASTALMVAFERAGATPGPVGNAIAGMSSGFGGKEVDTPFDTPANSRPS